jgi:hypothetical protein
VRNTSTTTDTVFTNVIKYVDNLDGHGFIVPEDQSLE